MGALDPAPLSRHIQGMTYTDLPFDTQEASKILSEAANGADDGDIYVQRSRSEGFVFDDGRLKSATYDTTQGFGMRVVAGEASGNAHSGALSIDAIRRAGETARQARGDDAKPLPKGQRGGGGGQKRDRSRRPKGSVPGQKPRGGSYGGGGGNKRRAAAKRAPRGRG